MHIQEHISLKEFTTLKIGGTARYFVSVTSLGELAEALSFARKENVPLVVLGGGSNVLISDNGFPGLVIRMELRGVTFKAEGTESVILIGAAGEGWDALVKAAVEKGLWGIENLSGIPGSVGAAPVQNIGAYGAELKDVVEWVEVFDRDTHATKKLSRDACQFGYRESIFKREKKRYVITALALRLSTRSTPNLSYKDVKNYFAEEKNPSLQDIRRAILEIRARKFPDLRTTGTAGSFFKNPFVSREKFETLRALYPDLPGFESVNSEKEPMVKVSLAWILENICGMKGLREGRVGLFERQPIVLINMGSASAEEVRIFAEKIISCVKEKTGISVEFEVAFLE